MIEGGPEWQQCFSPSVAGFTRVIVDKLLSRFGGFVVMARVKEILELPTFFDGKADVMSRASQYSTRYGSVRAGLGNGSV